jgi:hypothetical protein
MNPNHQLFLALLKSLLVFALSLLSSTDHQGTFLGESESLVLQL